MLSTLPPPTDVVVPEREIKLCAFVESFSVLPKNELAVALPAMAKAPDPVNVAFAKLRMSPLTVALGKRKVAEGVGMIAGIQLALVAIGISR